MKKCFLIVCFFIFVGLFFSGCDLKLQSSNLSSDKNNEEKKGLRDKNKFTTNIDGDYYLIPELGIKFRVPEKYSSYKEDLLYALDEDGNSVNFTSKSLLKKDSNCTTDFPSLGALIKVKGNFRKDKKYESLDSGAHWSMTVEGTEKMGAVQFNQFYVIYLDPPDVCADPNENPKVVEYQKKQENEIENFIKKVELIKE